MRSVVVDASLVLRLLIEEPGSVEAQSRWAEWKKERASIEAPTLLVYEAVNRLHQAWVHRLLTDGELTTSVELLLSLPIRYHEPLSLVSRVTEVARDLRAGAAYDSFYIALAEALQCEFWTGDKRLYNSAHDKMAFVRSIWEG
jgi:predicted nucleic acid-binding protein